MAGGEGRAADVPGLPLDVGESATTGCGRSVPQAEGPARHTGSRRPPPPGRRPLRQHPGLLLRQPRLPLRQRRGGGDGSARRHPTADALVPDLDVTVLDPEPAIAPVVPAITGTTRLGEPRCFEGYRSGSVRAMSSPESDEVGAYGHAVSPLNH
ncbi:hypothetical protein GCM10010294_35940 [Streptomyces griseoloalbus]|nr:hypothetical protein GCM10010294_35940 [Streptomyces griseoloalbus]